MDAPTGSDQLSPAFKTALTSPGGAAVQSEGSPGTKSVSVITANQALTNYNNMGTFATTQAAQNFQQQRVVAAAKAQADAAAAAKAQADGATKSTDSLTGAINSATGALNGTAGSTTGAGTTKTTASGNSYTGSADPYLDGKAAEAADNAAVAAKAKTDLATASTTAGLSVDQQNQLTNLGIQWDSLISAQQNANAMTEGQNSMALGRSGADRYSPATSASVMASVISSGTQKIGSLQNQKSSALSTMVHGFETDNVQAVKDAYKIYTDAATAQDKILDDMQKRLDDTAKAQADAAKANLDLQNSQQNFNKDMGVTSRFYQYPNSSMVYDSVLGKEVTQEQYTAMGGVGQAGGYKDIQVIDPGANAKHSASFTEWQDYKSTGGKLSYNDYMTMDANRKAVRSTTNNITYNQAQDQELQADISTTNKNLMSKAGKDGYVNVTDWKKAYDDWTNAGHNPKDFVNNNIGYTNPNSKDPYFGVTK